MRVAMLSPVSGAYFLNGAIAKGENTRTPTKWTSRHPDLAVWITSILSIILTFIVST